MPCWSPHPESSSLFTDIYLVCQNVSEFIKAQCLGQSLEVTDATAALGQFVRRLPTGNTIWWVLFWLIANRKAQLQLSFPGTNYSEFFLYMAGDWGKVIICHRINRYPKMPFSPWPNLLPLVPQIICCIDASHQSQWEYPPSAIIISYISICFRN